jgi:hypothetical protein
MKNDSSRENNHGEAYHFVENVDMIVWNCDNSAKWRREMSSPTDRTAESSIG